MLVHLLAVGFVVLVGATLNMPLLAAAICLTGIVVVACGYRGLENLVHGASHDYMSRDRAVNDLVGNALFGVAVGQNVDDFRRTHLPDHHGNFGAADDPCRVRMMAQPEVARGGLPTVLGTLRNVRADVVAYYRTAGARPAGLGLVLGWQALFVFGPAALVLGPQRALIAYLLVAPLSLLVVLPIVRAMAEAGEHDYARAEASVLERTFDNRGLLNYAVHAFGDGMHLTHHLAPGVPQWRLKKLHLWLLENEAGYRLLARYRSGLLSAPVRYASSEPIAEVIALVRWAAANDNQTHSRAMSSGDPREANDGQ